jgi:vacuolar protein sorting-associated protein 29
VLDYLKNLTADIYLSNGDFDSWSKSKEENLVLELAGFRIGLTHGHQIIPNGDPDALDRLQRKLDVDILITGHTHRHQVTKSPVGLQINPGSATGAYSVQSPHEAPPLPSFILLDLEGTKATVYAYTLQEGKVKVDKTDHTRVTSL